MSLVSRGRLAGLAVLMTALILGFQNCSLDTPGEGSKNYSSVDVQSTDIVFQSIPGDQVFYLGGPGIVNVVASSTAGHPLTFRWYKNEVELVGQTSSVLNLVSVAASDAGTYKLVANHSQGKNWLSFNVTVSSSPVITFSQQPSPVSVMAGQNASLTSTAVSTDNQSLTYQWFKDNVALAGFNTPTLNIAGASVAHAGMYYVEVTSTAGPVQKVKSNTVRVTVTSQFNVFATNGCVNGYCTCHLARQGFSADPAAALEVCKFKGYTDLVTFTVANGPIGALQCNANGSSCFQNAYAGNSVCQNVTCSR